MNIVGILKKLPEPLVIVGGLAHGLVAVGNPMGIATTITGIPFVQLAVGVSAVYLGLKWAKILK